MLDRVATLTWRRPKLVLALVGVFVVLAGAFGYDVETSPQGRGVHRQRVAERARDGASAQRARLRREPGDRRCSCAIPAAAGSTSPTPAVRREIDRISQALTDTRYVGHVVNPLRDRREGAGLIEPDGESLVITAGLSTQDVESDGGEAAEEAQRRIGDSPLDVTHGRLRGQLQRGQRRDARGPHPRRADRLPDPDDPAAARLPRRGRGRDPAAARRDLGPRHVPDAARDVESRRHVAVRAEHRDRAEPRLGRRLRIADGLALPRGARARRAAWRPRRRTGGRCRRPAGPCCSRASPSRSRWRRS